MSEEHRSIPWPDDGRPLRYRLRRSGRVRSVQLRVDVARGLEVVVPRRFPARTDVEPFLRENAAWIDEHLARANRRRELMPEASFRDGGFFPFFGRSCALSVTQRAGRKRLEARYTDGGLEIRTPRALTSSETRTAVVAFLRNAAREVLESRIRHWTRAIGVTCTGLTVREQETRWGSCSSSGRLSFNWRLVLGPPDVIDYVAAHEVAHLVHFDHGPGWEATLDRMLGDWRRWEEWLDLHGDLMVLPEGEEERAHQDSNLGPTD